MAACDWRVMSTIRFLLGDQLSPDVSTLRGADKARDVVFMAEVGDETRYVPHHRKKVAFILSAMRHFAEELRADGWRVEYVRLDDEDNCGSLNGELKRAVERLDASRVVVTAAGEHRVVAMQEALADEVGAPVEVRADDRFIVSREEFADWAEGRKRFLMEDFYRVVRRKTGLLMEGDKPAGGRWNFDKENRKPAEQDLFMPKPFAVKPDKITRAVLNLVARETPDGFGDLEPFFFAVTRKDAEAARDVFLKEALPRFGDYQDAMLRGEPFLYHSILSPYINVGLLDPLDLCRRAEAEWKDGRAPLNCVEGFIRQIIGWREYVRGIYFHAAADYVDQNELGADRDLPAFYWTGETDMACVRAVVAQTREHAYAHHIQRLMVTGNFALLAGIEPRQVHEWYLAVYADAFEWVEAPNTIGMALFADGGFLATKPYAASGSYIDRMSDYCGGCRYDVKQRTSADACPFNSLYWDFIARHEDRLSDNHRMGFAFRNWRKMSKDKQDALRARAQALLDGLETYTSE